MNWMFSSGTQTLVPEYDENGNPVDTRTELQRHALYELLKQLRHDYPQARIAGHCELPGTTKPCPCYLPSQEYKDLQPH